MSTDIYEKGKFNTFENDAIVNTNTAFHSTCDICGEWLDFVPTIVLDPGSDKFEIKFKAGSCGETFILEATQFKMIKEEKSELL
jgi:hypothetical protein